MDHLFASAMRQRIAAGCACARAATRLIGGIGSFLLLVCSPPALAGVNTLTQVSVPGGDVTDVVFDPNDSSIAFAATSAGVYRSTDTGLHWAVAFDPATNALSHFAVNPADPGRVVVTGGGAPFYESSDHGATFGAMPAQPQDTSTGSFLAFSADGSMLYAASYQYVFRSPDGGKHWAKGAALPVDEVNSRFLSAFAVDPTNPLHLYATLYDIGQESTDGGATWHAWALPGYSRVLSMSVAKSTPQRVWIATSQGVFYTQDNGANWTNSSGFSPAYLVKVDPNDPAVVYANLTGGLSKTTDNGVHWTNLSEANVTASITSIAIDPHDSTSILISSWEGIAKSTDAGLHWALSESGIEARAVYEMKTSKTSQRVYANTNNGGFSAIASIDDSSTDLNSGRLRELVTSHIADVRTFYVEEGNPDVVMAAIGGGITKSTDGGMTWGPLVTLIGATYGASKITAASADHRVLLAETQDAIYRSEDAGDGWQALANPDHYTFSLAMASAPSKPTTLYAGAQAGTSAVLLKSLDGGTSWAPVTSFPPRSVSSITIDTTDDERVYVCTVDGVFTSSDAGSSWVSLIPFPGGGALSILPDPANPAVLYASTAYQVARSVDGGSHWQQIVDKGTAFWVFETVAVSPSDSSTVYIGTMGRGVHQIQIAPNLGLAATLVPLTVSVGARASYSLSVTNAGPFDATGVRVTFTLPDIVSDPSVSMEGGQCSLGSDHSATCNISVLKTGSKSAIDLSMDDPTEGKVAIHVALAGDQPDPVQSDNTLTIGTTVSAAVPAPTTPAPMPSTQSNTSTSKSAGGGGSMQFTVLSMLFGILMARELSRLHTQRREKTK